MAMAREDKGRAATCNVVEEHDVYHQHQVRDQGSKYWMSPTSMVIIRMARWMDTISGLRMESMSMEATDSHRECGDSHTPHIV